MVIKRIYLWNGVKNPCEWLSTEISIIMDNNEDRIKILNNIIIKHKKFKFICYFSIIALFFSISCSHPHSIDIKKNELHIKEIREIILDTECFPLNPSKVIIYHEKVFILDKKLCRIFVFSKEAYTNCIGKTGQGPGEIFQPISFDIDDNKLYVLNMPDRFEIFDIDGNYLGSIRLERNQYGVPSFWDIEVYNKMFYLSSHIGTVKVERYKLTGEFIDAFIGKHSSIVNRSNLLSVPYKVHICPSKKFLLLVNQFEGDIETYDLVTGKLLTIVKGYDPYAKEKCVSIRNSFIESSNIEGELNVKTFILFQSFMDNVSEILLIIPAQIDSNNERYRNSFYIYDLNKYILELTHINFIGSGKRTIRNCFFIDYNLIFLDTESNLYIGGIENEKNH